MRLYPPQPTSRRTTHWSAGAVSVVGPVAIAVAIVESSPSLPGGLRRRGGQIELLLIQVAGPFGKLLLRVVERGPHLLIHLLSVTLLDGPLHFLASVLIGDGEASAIASFMDRIGDAEHGHTVQPLLLRRTHRPRPRN